MVKYSTIRPARNLNEFVEDVVRLNFAQSFLNLGLEDAQSVHPSNCLLDYQQRAGVLLCLSVCCPV